MGQEAEHKGQNNKNILENNLKPNKGEYTYCKESHQGTVNLF